MFRSTVKIILSSIIIISTSEYLLRLSGTFDTYQEKNGHPYLSAYENKTPGEHLYRHSARNEKDSCTFAEFVHVRFINSLGFPEEKDSAAMQRAPMRILALGDSFTEGVGAQFHESWPQQLEALLTGNGSNCFVYNAGVLGSDPFFSCKNAEFLFPKIKPVLVIMLINSSDFNDVYVRGGWDRFQRDGTTRYAIRPPWWEPVYSRSHLARGLVKLIGFNSYLTRDSRKEWFAKSTPLILSALDSLAITCRQNNAAMFPVFLQLRKREEEKLFAEELSKKYPASLSLSLDEKFHWPIDGHCKPEGYALLAEEIEKKIIQQSLITP